MYLPLFARDTLRIASCGSKVAFDTIVDFDEADEIVLEKGLLAPPGCGLLVPPGTAGAGTTVPHKYQGGCWRFPHQLRLCDRFLICADQMGDRLTNG